MYTLNKHKRRGADGFKDFVKNLELFPSSTVRDMIFLGLLEDPVYLKYALENRISFNFFVSLEVDDVLKIYELLKGGLNVLVMALKGTSEEEEFITQKLPTPLQRQYWEEQEHTSVTVTQQDSARIMIMEKVLELEKRGELPKISWKMPPVKILEGQDYTIDDKGQFIQRYDNGKTALKGTLEKRLRAGMWEHFYPNGKMFAKGYYVSGEKADEWTFFYPDGKIKSLGIFKDDKKHGVWKEYDREGREIHIEYQAGKVV